MRKFYIIIFCIIFASINLSCRIDEEKLKNGEVVHVLEERNRFITLQQFYSEIGGKNKINLKFDLKNGENIDLKIAPYTIYKKTSNNEKINYSMMLLTNDRNNKNSDFYNLYVERLPNNDLKTILIKHSPSKETVNNNFRNYHGSFQVLKILLNNIDFTSNKTDHCI